MIRVDCSKAKTLREAVALCRDSLKSFGRSDYAGLVDEERVRSAILTSIESYRSQVKNAAEAYGGDFPWAHDEFVLKQSAYFESTASPVFVTIVETGKWPASASFFYFLTRTDDNNVKYDCFCLRIEVATPESEFVSFALPLVDLYFGMFSSNQADN